MQGALRSSHTLFSEARAGEVVCESRRAGRRRLIGKRLRKHGDWKGLRVRETKERGEKRQLSEEFELFPSTIVAGRETIDLV